MSKIDNSKKRKSLKVNIS